MVASMRLPAGWSTPMSVSLWSDGQPQPGRFTMIPGEEHLRVPLPVEVCDGRPHVFELRLPMSGQLLDQYATIGPMSATPWDALQKFAGMPLPAQLSPMAAYRYLSLGAGLSSAARTTGASPQFAARHSGRRLRPSA